MFHTLWGAQLAEQRSHVMPQGRWPKGGHSPDIILVDVGKPAVSQLVAQLIQPCPWLVDVWVGSAQPGVGERLVPDGDPQPVRHPAQVVVGFVSLAVAVRNKCLDLGEQAVELEESMPIASDVSIASHRVGGDEVRTDVRLPQHSIGEQADLGT